MLFPKQVGTIVGVLPVSKGPGKVWRPPSRCEARLCLVVKPMKYWYFLPSCWLRVAPRVAPVCDPVSPPEMEETTEIQKMKEMKEMKKRKIMQEMKEIQDMKEMKEMKEMEKMKEMKEMKQMKEIK